MKKAMVILAGTLALVGAASAGNVSSTVSAKVDNLCVYQTTMGQDVNNNNYAGSSISLGSYKANADTTKPNQQMVAVVCNRGTSLKSEFPPSITLTSGNGQSQSTLLVNVSRSTDGPMIGQGNEPDSYNVQADLTIKAGQWGAKGGDYSGTLNVLLSYN